MISFTPEFEAIMKQPEKVVRVEVLNYGPENTDVPVDPVAIWGEDLKSFNMDSVGMFLGSAARMVTATVFEDQSPYIGSRMRIDLKALQSDNTWEVIELGYFTVYQVEYNIETQMSKVTLYDPLMMLSVTPYNLETAQFPMTIAQLASVVADIANTTLDTNFGSLPNQDFTITENLWATIQNTTFRDVAQQIAEATGTTAVVSGTELLFKQYTAPTETIDETNLIKFRMGQKWGNVNSVALSRMPQNDNIAVSDDADTDANGIYEVVIINNQIVDDDRVTLIQPLYDALVTETPYITFYDSEFTTEGHGWYEIGDVITASLSGIEYPVMITEHHLYVGPEAFTESIKSTIPTNPSVNKTTSGGILRTLWNTELKVDRQENEIVSIVSRQDEFENLVENTFTEIVQDVNSITSTIQDGGGMNQIYNSVGYSTDNGDINFWTPTGLTASSRADTSAFTAGAISGSTIDLTGAAGTFTQRVQVTPGGFYSISFFGKKETQGVVTVSASNDLDNFSVVFEDDTNYEWAKYRIDDDVNGTTYIVPTSNYLDITFEIDADVDLFSFTDLVMVRGIADKGWSQAVGEVANTNVTFDTTGITVKSNVYEGAYTRMTPIEFAGYDSQGQRAFAVNNDTTEVNHLEIDGNIDTPQILIVSLSSGPNAGMNFVVKG